uniref:Tryptophan 2,3-dioxygenase n=1 Tax=Spongospora subterranea TaxID=70186 RepID=A0A0H5QIN6_9EUKA|eukprot:CRZ01945.1 hypothetical protein [Spongospora subterranea]
MPCPEEGSVSSSSCQQTCYYSSYLKLESLLSCQNPITKEHDESLFITVHQTSELWFKQMILEVESIVRGLCMPRPPLLQIANRLQRICRILTMLITEIGILETMSPLDFQEFRSQLVPASGFQSVQFKILEIRMGLSLNRRVDFNKDSYLSVLQPKDRHEVEQSLNQMPLSQAVEKWLCSYSGSTANFWPKYTNSLKNLDDEVQHRCAPVVDLERYQEQIDKGMHFMQLEAVRSAIMLQMTRNEPDHGLPSVILSRLVEMDTLMAKWRFHHSTMVLKMIGTMTGTGGVAGVSYLRMTSSKHMVFADLYAINEYVFPTSLLETSQKT